VSVVHDAAYSRIRGASEQTAFAIVVTIGRHSFAEPVVSASLQQSRQHIFEWRPDGALCIERFASIVPERTQRG
jgi:hypothetical protein